MTIEQNKGLPIALLAAISFSAIATSKVNAAIVTVNDSGSWINGDNTLAQQGFNLIPVPNGAEAVGSDISTLNSPVGDIGFNGSISKRQIGNQEPGKAWGSWSNGYQGEVYYAGIDVLTLDIKVPNLAAFDFYAQPDFQQLATISAIAQSGEISDVLSQQVDGSGGAKYFGFYSDNPLDPIQSIQITADKRSGGFAIAQLRGATATVPSVPSVGKVPTPLLLPAMIGLSLGLWRKARSRSIN